MAAIFGYIGLGILGLLVLLVAILLINTARVGTKTPKAPVHNLPSKEVVDHYAGTLSKMVSCETITARDGNNDKIYRFHALMEELFPNVHKTLEKIDIGGALLYKWSGTGEGDKLPMLLMAHMDVVPAEGDWNHDPFGGEISDGVIWGRGAVDTKGSLCGFMNAVEDLIKEGYTPPCDVYLASSNNEEIGGVGAPDTVAYLDKQGVRLGLVLDEGGAITDAPLPGLNGKFAMVGLMEKGHGQFDFVARSNGGHASTPPLGTPIARLAAMVNYIEKKQPFDKKLSAPILGMFEAMVPYMKFSLRLVLCNLWLFRPILIKLMPKLSPLAGAMLQTTCAFTMAKGSEAPNVLPQEARITANLRFISHERMDASLRKLKSIGDMFDVEVEKVGGGRDASNTSSTDSYGYQKVKSTVESVFPDATVAPYIMLQGSDSRNYEKICDCVLRFAPLNISKEQMDSIHALDENLGVDALAGAVTYFKELIKNYNS